jgi:hypothetical protein
MLCLQLLADSFMFSDKFIKPLSFYFPALYSDILLPAKILIGLLRVLQLHSMPSPLLSEFPGQPAALLLLVLQGS